MTLPDELKIVKPQGVKIMAWSTIREVTEEDFERLNATARRFAERHGKIKTALGGDKPTYRSVDRLAIVNDTGAWDYDYRIAAMWRACVRRALREKNADGIAYGYVGFHA